MCNLKQTGHIKQHRTYSEGSVKTVDNVILTANSSSYGHFLYTALQNYTAAPLCFSAISNHSYHSLEFEKKICRAGFKKSFGQNLPSPGALEMNFGILDVTPNVDSSRWKKKYKRDSMKVEALDAVESQNYVMTHSMAAHLCFKTREPQGKHPRLNNDKGFIHSGIQLLSASWVLEGLICQIKNKRSVRAVLNELIRDAEVLLKSVINAPVVGVRITASGRLGKKKKGMAQQQSVSIGKVPLGTFSRKVDYCQGFVVTKLGMVGLKVWVAFR
jgi:hypothetical protein